MFLAFITTVTYLFGAGFTFERAAAADGEAPEGKQKQLDAVHAITAILWPLYWTWRAVCVPFELGRRTGKAIERRARRPSELPEAEAGTDPLAEEISALEEAGMRASIPANDQSAPR